MAWTDDEPVRGGYPDPSLLALSGLDRMRAGIYRWMVPPPIHHLFGLEPVAASPAGVTFRMPCSPWLQTDAGVFFAGTAALVADAPLGSAILTGLGPGQVAVTSDLSFNFLRPVGVTSKQLICRARSIEVGKSLGVAEGLVEDANGRIVAHCTTRCFVMSLPFEPSDGKPQEVERPAYDSPDPYLRPATKGGVVPHLYEEIPFIEIVARRASGELEPPPFIDLFHFGPPEASEGRFAFPFPASPWMSSPAGSVYGGVLAYVGEAALTGAMATTLGVGESAAALDLKVQFVRPVRPDRSELRAEARVVHRGRSFVAAQGEIKNAEGKTVALMMSSAVVRSGIPWSAFAVADDAVSGLET